MKTQEQEKAINRYVYSLNNNKPATDICVNDVPPEYGNITDQHIIPIMDNPCSSVHKTSFDIALTFKGGQIVYVSMDESLKETETAKIKINVNCNLEPN